MNGPPDALLAFNINGNLIEVAFVLVVLILTVLGQLGAKLQQRRPPLPRSPRPQPPDETPLQSEIEEFLRRASGQPVENRPVVATVVAEPAVARPSRPPARKAAEETAEQPVGDEVVKQVEKFLDVGEFSRRTSKLGGEVSQADAQLDERLKQTFGHEVGGLAKKPGETALRPDIEAPADTPVPVFNFAAFLANPEALRQAILLSEILRRPDERWA